MAVTISGSGTIDVGGTSTSQGTVRLYEDTDNGTNYVELVAPASVASNVTLTMPTTTGTVATVAGSDTQVIFNDGGSAYGGDSGLTYNKTTDNLTIAGNLVIGTSGKGIDFSATSGTGTSELLADYEEGTWTPTAGGSLTVVGTFSSNGKYTKVGRIVTVSGTISATTSLTTSANNQIIGGLPFNNTADGCGGGISSGNANQSLLWTVSAGTTQLYSTTTIGPYATLYFSCTYIAS